MIAKEYCRYVRSYSELEGLQRARTVRYSARSTAQGIVLELDQEQSGCHAVDRVLIPAGNFPRAMQLMKYLCENAIGPEQWLDVLDDVQQPFRPLLAANPPQSHEIAEMGGEFVAFV